MPVSFAILEAPSRLGLSTPGVERLPQALLDAGLDARLGARRAGRIEPPAHDPRVDPETGVLNPRGIAAYASDLADAVGAVVEGGAFPVVLGGDCTILLGCVLALKRRGRAGLLFLDGQADFYQPEAEQNGEGASMELAFATGHGPPVVTDLEGRGPLLREADVVSLGRRDAEDAEAYGSRRIEDSAIGLVDLDEIRRDGLDGGLARALARLTAPHLDGFWIHLDADVLDDAIMPAVDYRMPGGLTWDEVSAVLRAALASGRALGLDVTIYNPRLDPAGALAPRFVEALAGGLTRH